MNRSVRVLSIGAGLSILLTASGLAQTAQPSATVLAPAPSQTPRQTPAPVFTPPPRTPDPELDLPDTDTAKRVTGLGGEASGGADCRAACDKTYYLCLPNDPSGQCPGSWALCVAACPANSSNF
jgi:hypothetical protein